MRPTPPPDLTANLWVCSKPREAYQRWKSRHISIEYYEYTVRACREAVRKVQPKLKLFRDVKNPKKGFFVYVNSKKQKENVDLMLNRRDQLVTNNTEKARGSQHFLLLCLLHPALLGPRPWKQKSRLMQTQIYCQWRKSRHVSCYTSLTPTNLWTLTLSTIHPRMLRELADIIARLLSIISEKSHRSGDCPGDWKKANITSIYKKGLKEDHWDYRTISLIQSLGKLLNKSSLGLSEVKWSMGLGKVSMDSARANYA